jgi:hypothetical protein
LPDAKFCSSCGSPITSKGKGETKPQKLYHCYSIVNNLGYKGIHYDKVKISWFVKGREKPQVPFEQAIANYSTLTAAARSYPENYILERFTQMEVELLKGYLSSVQKIKAAAEEIKLPVSENKKGYKDVPPIPGTDFIVLHEKQNYNLPFKVEGIFNIKLADERIVGDEQETVISKIVVGDFKK